ncbi:hypothetical protein [Loktanella sp. R86503]|uniref:hypothetical protein n=1 Tax=Loktanella sp. R86503 TaxID=3093847 RepID=UPI0036DF56B1
MMSVAVRPIKDAADVARVVQLFKEREKPFTVTITPGLPRTNPQNALQRKWVQEAAEQLGDGTPEEKRGYCKLHFGVPILRNEHPVFAEKYDRIIRPHPYAEKLEMMMDPLDFPVTRLMNTKQKTAYLDAMRVHFEGQGVVLTIPEAGA